MKILFALLLLGSAPLVAQRTLTIDEALSLAHAAETRSDVSRELSALSRTMRYPSLRTEGTVNSSRTLDIFSEGPLQLHSATAVVAADWTLYDSGARQARLEALAARVRELENPSDRQSRDAAVVDAFADLALAQRERELLEPLGAELDELARRGDVLVERGELSILSASERHDAALAVRSRLLDNDARRVDAEERLRELTNLSDTPIRAEISQRDVVAPPNNNATATASPLLEESAARLREAEAAKRLRVLLSGYTGFGSARSTFRSEESSGSFGVYGLRLQVTLPLVDWEVRRQIAEARVKDEEVRESEARSAALRRERDARLRRAAGAASARVALLTESATAARQRVESLQRLVSGGVRGEADLLRARVELSERESQLVAAQIDAWRFQTLLDTGATQ